MFKKYIDYIKDNPKGYWFKRKWFGWGWTPVTWQGWLVIAGFTIFIIFQSVLLELTSKSSTDFMLFIANIMLAVIAMILICKLKGEKPKWQWGIPKEEKESKENN